MRVKVVYNIVLEGEPATNHPDWYQWAKRGVEYILIRIFGFLADTSLHAVVNLDSVEVKEEGESNWRRLSDTT